MFSSFTKQHRCTLQTSVCIHNVVFIDVPQSYFTVRYSKSHEPSMGWGFPFLNTLVLLIQWIHCLSFHNASASNAHVMGFRNSWVLLAQPTLLPVPSSLPVSPAWHPVYANRSMPLCPLNCDTSWHSSLCQKSPQETGPSSQGNLNSSFNVFSKTIALNQFN